MSQFAGGDDEQKYRATTAIFNSGVFENALKWEEYEPQKGAPKPKLSMSI